MQFLFLFLDGVGLGRDDPDTNPFARAHMPNVENILGGARLLLGTLSHAVPGDFQRYRTERADLLQLDANLGIPGLPQSASGQATLLTGTNVPAALGYHYGPKPNPPVAEFLNNGNIFKTVMKSGLRAGFLNAYPPRYFSAIESGRRLYSAIPLAVIRAGLALKTASDLMNGQAISADLTAQGWRSNLGLPETPTLTPAQAGEKLTMLARDYHFAFFEFWLTDYAGHGQKMDEACTLLETFDQALGGLFNSWDDQKGLILLTSDHGNLEDLSTRKHTYNPVPALLVGGQALRERFIQYAEESARRRFEGQDHRNETPLSCDLTDIAPAILRSLNIPEN
jgi:hypothetical protein